VLRAKIGLAEPRFIYHWMLSAGTLRQAERVAVGSNYPAVNESDVANFIVQLPSISQQRRIAEILDALDARIRCQDQLIAKLVAVQQGLESSLLDMPDIPSESLANYLASSPKNGYSPKEVDEWTGMVALGLGCLTANGFQPRQLKNVPSGDSRNVGAVLRDGDLLMSRANTRELVGLVGIYKDVGHDCIYPDLMMRLTPTKRCRVGYLELVLRSSAVRRQIQGMAQGTSESMVKISSSIVQDLKVQIPDLAVQDRILEVVDAARARRDAEEAVRDGLLRLKAGLAEDLLTGRVRVPEAEAVVESL
jgi:type I restriction enzyme S subunit